MRVGIVSILFSPSPLDITVTEGYPSTQADVLLCTFSAVNKYYYKYSVFGVNVVLLNILFIFPFFLPPFLASYFYFSLTLPNISSLLSLQPYSLLISLSYSLG